MASPGDAAALPRSRAASAPWGRLGLGGQTLGAAGFLLLLVLYNILFNRDVFLNLQSLRVNLTQVAPIVIVGVGMTLVVATGGIDLSVGSLMAIAGSVAPLIFLSDVAPFSTPYLGGFLAYLLPILVAGLFGLFNGWLVTAFNLQPIIATLVLFVAGRGIAQVITDGRLQSFREPGWQTIGIGRVLGIPVQAILMVVVVAAAAWAMRATVFGRYVLAVGDNEAASRLAGVPVDRVKRSVYAVSGLLAGLAGLIAIAINSSSDANQIGLNVELDVIAAVAVGGTSLMGGRATVVGTFIGALIIQLIRFTLLTQGIGDATARIITAAAIVVGVLLQRRRAS